MIDTSLLKTEAEKIGVLLNAKALSRFDMLADMLVERNRQINLTAISEPHDIVIKHFLDSLTPLAHIGLHEGAHIIDVGCGAGFPGLPILIARPDLKCTFLDSVEKKLRFIADYLDSADIFGETLHLRAEVAGAMGEYREKFDAVFTRAVAPLNILAEYCLPLLGVGGIYVSMKGVDDEVEIGRSAVETLGGKVVKKVSLELTNGDKRNLVIIKKVSHTPTNYPRKSKKIATAPL